MKKLISLALAALLLLNLAACGKSSVSNPSGSSSDSSSSADPAQPDAFSPVTTEDEIRALYGDDASLITSIEAYQGDFLVKLGTDEDCPSLDWVYGQSGIRRRMLWLDTPLLRCEIESQATVRVVTGGPNIFNGVPMVFHAWSWPHCAFSTMSRAATEAMIPMFLPALVALKSGPGPGALSHGHAGPPGGHPFPPRSMQAASPWPSRPWRTVATSWPPTARSP